MRVKLDALFVHAARDIANKTVQLLQRVRVQAFTLFLITPTVLNNDGF